MRNKFNITKEFLEEEYVNKGRTLKEIATELQCSIPLISKKLKNFGLNIDKKEKYLKQTFGDLYVEEFIGHDMHAHAIFRCKCKCGKYAEVLGYSLLSGNTKSCGCVSRKRGKHHPLYMGYEELHGRIWKSLIRGAESRNLEFNITIEEAWNKFLEQDRKCALTGLPISFSERTNEQTKTTASLDRKDSTKGYTKENIQWVHKKINYLKMDSSEEDFIALCKQVANHNSIEIKNEETVHRE